MNIQKELPDIAWNVSEPEYRADSALSYSTLSTYDKTGFNGLDHLFDKKESPSLLLGSCVDTILTGGTDEFNSLFIVKDINISDSGVSICKALASMYPTFNSFTDIPESIVSEVAKSLEFWSNDKWDARRYKEVLKTGDVVDYFDSLKNCDKIIITSDVYTTAVEMVKALRESPATAPYFADNDSMSPIKRYYQLKFKATLEGVNYRCMADLNILDYEGKKIIPCDLKTSSKPEWDFYKSFIEWKYAHQARLYASLIKATIAKDDYFKDFTVEDYRFIVVNKATLVPLVWKFKDTHTRGDLVYGKNKQIVIRDPFEIGKELQSYLDLRPNVPNGIVVDGVNDIVSHLEEL